MDSVQVEDQVKNTKTMTTEELAKYTEAKKWERYEYTKVNVQFRERVLGLLKEGISKNIFC